MAKLQGVKLSEALRKKQANRSSNNYKPQKNLQEIVILNQVGDVDAL